MSDDKEERCHVVKAENTDEVEIYRDSDRYSQTRLDGHSENLLVHMYRMASDKREYEREGQRNQANAQGYDYYRPLVIKGVLLHRFQEQSFHIPLAEIDLDVFCKGIRGQDVLQVFVNDTNGNQLCWFQGEENNEFAKVENKEPPKIEFFNYSFDRYPESLNNVFHMARCFREHKRMEILKPEEEKEKQKKLGYAKGYAHFRKLVVDGVIASDLRQVAVEIQEEIPTLSPDPDSNKTKNFLEQIKQNPEWVAKIGRAFKNATETTIEKLLEDYPAGVFIYALYKDLKQE